MSHQHSTDKTTQVIAIAAVAALVGAATAMLLTPKSGEETRAELKQRAAGVARKAKARFSEEEELEEIIEAVRDRLQQATEGAASEAKKTSAAAKRTVRSTNQKATKPGTPRK